MYVHNKYIVPGDSFKYKYIVVNKEEVSLLTPIFCLRFIEHIMLLLESIAEQEMEQLASCYSDRSIFNVTTPFQHSWPLKTLIIHPKSIGEKCKQTESQ